MNKPNIILIDDDNDVLQAYQLLLEMEGYYPKTTSDPQQLLDFISPDWQGIIISDIYMPALSGWDLLSKIQQIDHHLPVIFITGHGDVPMAIKAMQQGAFYFIEKPIVPEQLLTQIKLALTQRQQYCAQKQWQQQQLEIHFIGQSHWIKQLRQRLQQFAETDLSVFIFGEIGTGRSLAAHYLYKMCQNRFPNYQEIELVNSYTATQLENDLKQVNQHCLMIKNIEYLDKNAQKLLAQLIQQNHSTFRLIAISQYSPQQLLTQFGLLPELFYAFSLTQIECIPLSHRTSDIEPLSRYYLQLTCQKLKKKKPNVSEGLIKQLIAQPWLGNIDQLINTAELYAVGVTVQNSDLQIMPDPQGELSLDDLVEQYEKKILIDVLDRFQGKINNAAHYLQIPRKKLYLRMKKYHLDKKDYRE